MLESAFLEIRVFPWRPRTRVIKASAFREAVATEFSPIDLADGLTGFLVGLGLWLTLLLAAPLIVLVLAAALFSVELPVVIGIALALVVSRFAGVIPWTVVMVNQVTGQETRETYRNGWRAVRRIREVNTDRRVTVRWAWA